MPRTASERTGAAAAQGAEHGPLNQVIFLFSPLIMLVVSC